MAYTKIHEIKATLDKAINYVTNPEKTDEKILISTFACSQDTSDLEFDVTRKKHNFTGKNLAYHAIQSFKPDELTPEQAHNIGIQTADELLKGKYEYVISTHVDRNHIHNHIIINSVNFESGLSFGTEHDRKNNPAWKQLRKISDEICLENKISVISLPEKGYGKCYYEWLQDQRGNSFKGQIKRAIDESISKSNTFDEFIQKMKDKNFEYKLRGNSLSFKAEGQERFTRCSRRTLGWYYELSQLQKRIEWQQKKQTSKIIKDNGLYQVNDESAIGLKRWADLKNMQETSKALNILSEFGVSSIQELEEKISDCYDRKFDASSSLNKLDKQVVNDRELLKMLNTYWDTKAIHDEYLKSKNRENFKKTHEKELDIYSATKSWLKEKIDGSVLPNRSVLEMKITELENSREALLDEYRNSKIAINKLESAHEKIEKYLNLDKVEIHKKDNQLE